MRGFVKMSALSAVLSFTLVTAYNQAWSSQPQPTLDTSDQTWSTQLRPARGAKFQGRLSDPDAGSGPAIDVAQPLRSAKGDRLAVATECADQTWPHIAPACLSAGPGDAPRNRVRMITVESRDGTNTSLLTRIPQPAVASR